MLDKTPAHEVRGGFVMHAAPPARHATLFFKAHGMLFLFVLASVIDSFTVPALAVGLLAVGTGFVFLHSGRHAVALVLSSVIAVGAGFALKMLFAVPRLDSALVGVTGYRFPSQHALATGAFFGSLCLSALCLLRPSHRKTLAVILSLAAIGIVAWSRVFLHAHLPIDVIVGSLLGIGVSLLTHYLVFWKKYRRAGRVIWSMRGGH